MVGKKRRGAINYCCGGQEIGAAKSVVVAAVRVLIVRVVGGAIVAVAVVNTAAAVAVVDVIAAAATVVAEGVGVAAAAIGPRRVGRSAVWPFGGPRPAAGACRAPARAPGAEGGAPVLA